MDEVHSWPPFDVPTFLRHLREEGCSLGEPFHYFACTSSTNDEAKRAAAAGAPSGSTFLADAQTAGRGRYGRQWLGQPNAQLLVSVLWRPRPSLALSSITLAVGAALHRALSRAVSTHRRLSVKWPNDIEFDRRKLAGILVERGESREYGVHTVFGFGINVHASPRLIRGEQPISLQELGGATPRELLLAQCLRALSTELTAFERDRGAQAVAYVNHHHALAGESVTVGETTGRVVRIAVNGALVIETSTGEVEVTAGTVERA